MTIRVQAFVVGNAQIVVRQPMGIDRIDARVIYRKLDYDRASDIDKNRVSDFAEWVLRTVSFEGEMGYPWAKADSSVADMQAAYDAWVLWPENLTSLWAGELYLTETPLSEPGTQLGEDPKNEPPPQSTTESG